MRAAKQLSILCLIWLLGACASLGLVPAETFEQKLAYAYGTHTAVMQAAADALIAKEIDADEGAQVLKLADESRALLDAARSLQGIDPGAATNRLVLATTILTQLQSYLRRTQ